MIAFYDGLIGRETLLLLLFHQTRLEKDKKDPQRRKRVKMYETRDWAWKKFVFLSFPLLLLFIDFLDLATDFRSGHFFSFFLRFQSSFLFSPSIFTFSFSFEASFQCLHCPEKRSHVWDLEKVGTSFPCRTLHLRYSFLGRGQNYDVPGQITLLLRFPIINILKK